MNLGPTLPSTAINVTRNLQPQIGITSTPTIDLSSNTIFVVAETYENSQAIFRLHALDLTTGAEKFNGPAVIQGSVPGSSSDSVGGVLTFSAVEHWQRPGLLLWGGVVYVAFGSHEDQAPYHGWVFGYNATTLAQSVIFCTSPNGVENGIWQGGSGLTVDPATGYLYLATGNGTFDVNTGGTDYGDGILQLDTANHLNVLDYFTPSNQDSLSSTDADLGSGGVLLIPGSTYGIAGGKDGTMYLFDRRNLGQYNPNVDQVAQEWQATYSYVQTGDAGFFGGFVWYNSNLYTWGRRDYLKEYTFNGTTFNTTPTQSSFAVPDGYSDEPAMSISANGLTAGSAILWSTYSTNGDRPNGGASPGILVALNASDITQELWDSNQNQARDYSGSWAKWAPPTIANGKVYVPTFDNVLNVYGLLSSSSSGALLGSGNSSQSAVNLTSEGTTDWEHWGDGSLNRKTGVTPQLSDYAVVGTGTASSYSTDPRPSSWTDGTPLTASSNNTNEALIQGVGQGFSFQAPADTGARTLVVHVGGDNSGGTLTAHLSDGSAADFTDVTTVVSGPYDRNYTLTYHAASAQQTLTVTWTMTSGTGDVTLSGAALNGAVIVASGGTPQSTPVGTAFATSLQATVMDGGGNPLSGVTVTFTAPASGASGTFAGGTTTARVASGSNGIAVAPAFTANGQAGNYAVTAIASGIASTVNFNLTNSSSLTGILNGTGNSSQASVNLTSEGSLDWMHWGDALNRKAGVAAQLSNETTTGEVQLYNNDPRPVSWTDGAPTVSSVNNLDGLYVSGVGQGFSFTAPADTTARTLIVHVGGYQSGGTLTAHLSDGSATDFTDVTANASGQYDRNYTLTYAATSAGQTLTVSWVMNSGSGNVTLSAAALSGGGSISSLTASGGTPQSAMVSTAFGTALQATVTSGGNPVSGVTVTFTAPGSGASGTFAGGSTTANIVTGSNGIAVAPAFTANSKAGSYTVTATATGATGTASYSLTNTAGAAATVTASAGSGQSTTVSTTFATALQATVTDGGGNPVNGVLVTFTAPTSGASGTFAGGSTTASVATGSNGIAIAPALTANSQAASFAVTAAVAGVASPASFTLTNTTSGGGGTGTLTGTGTSSQALVNLTSEGTADWVHWGDSSLNRKAGVAAQLTTYTVLGGGTVSPYNNDLRPASWTDGTPTSSSSNNLNGVFTPWVGQGFSIQAPADTTVRTLVLHVGGWFSGGTLTAHLSDGSAANFTDVTTNTNGQYDRNYTLIYAAASAGQTLTVTWVMNSGTGNVTLNAAALSMSGSTSTVTASGGTPQSAAISTAFSTALQATVTSGGNPVSGVMVTFTAPSGGASGTFAGGSTTASIATDSNGIAVAPAFTANSKAGSYTVTAGAAGASGAPSFSLTNTAGAAANITASAGSGQSTTVSTTFATALQATVTDSGGNPLNGVMVTFSAPSSGASGTFTGGSPTANIATSSDGIAMAPAFTANNQTGNYSVTASVSGVAPASFSLTNSAFIQGWYNTNWIWRKQLTVNHSQIMGSSGLTNFPMLYSVTDPNLATVANGGGTGKADGTDILFTASDGVTKLNHELEYYNPSTGQVIAWVQVPSISPTVDTLLYVYYGNSSAPDQQNKAGAWNPNYLAVYHMADDAGSTAVADSTGVNNGAR